MTGPRLRLLLSARADQQRGDLAGRLESSLGDAGDAGGAVFGWGVRTPGDPIELTAHRTAIGPDPAGFDAFLEVGAEGATLDDLIRVLAPVLEAARPAVDIGRSTVIAGTHRLLMPRQGPYMTLFALRRRPDLTAEAFFDYWVNRHAPMVTRGFNERGSYYQFHSIAEETRMAADRLGMGGAVFDGHAGGWLRDPASLASSLRSPGALLALEDERQFIDHSRSFLAVYAIGGR